jgi:hypothetical protein
VYSWEFNDPQIQHAAEELPAVALAALRAFMEAVVFDPNEYGRTPDEPVGLPVRRLPFGAGMGLVTIQVYDPDRLVLVLRIQWLG